jgi:Na+/glutamate symporter
MLSNLLAFKNLFALALTVWFGYVAWESWHFPFLAKVFPFYIGAALFVLGIVNLGQQLRRAVQDRDTAGFADLSTDWSISIEIVWRRFFVFFVMILVLYAMTWVIGYPVTMTVFIFFFYRSLARASWWASAVAGLCGLGFLALTSHLLNMTWPEGLLVLPWPLG